LTSVFTDKRRASTVPRNKPTSDRAPGREARSPYEAELQRGNVALQFPVALEREYRQSHLQRSATRVRGWQLSLLVVGIVAALYRFIETGAFGLNLESVLRIGVLAPACIAMLVAAFGRQYFVRYLPTAFAGSMLAAAAVGVLVALSAGEHLETGLMFLSTFIFGTFFVAGLLLLDAVLVAAIGIVAFAVAAAYFGLPSGVLAYQVLLVSVVAAVGGYIAHDVEVTNRRMFLERGVLGDLAERDGLTALRNRRAFDEQLARVWQQSLRDRSSLAVLLIDIDHFKSYNDEYGHQAGDVCLQHIGELVQRFARRPLDIAARYGGEEMALVLFQVTDEHAMAVADQLRGTIESQRIEHRGAPTTGLVTVSIGVAWMQAALDRAPDDAIQLADQALYAAKLAGRNQVKFMKPGQAGGYTRQLRRLPRAVGPGPIGVVVTNPAPLSAAGAAAVGTAVGGVVAGVAGSSSDPISGGAGVAPPAA
jgi:diguanylate cyclase (GGDEF)-like protein